MDMVRSMMSYSTLPINLWMEVLKTAIYIFNRVPSKSVQKILYELWTGREPSLNHFHVWGCPAEAKVLKHPLIREDLNVIQYQSQEADNTFITSDGTSPYNSAR